MSPKQAWIGVVVMVLTAFGSALAEPIQVRLGDRAAEPPPAPLTKLAVYALQGPERLGGLSGMVLEPGANRLIMVGDRGDLFAATIEWDRAGEIEALADWSVWRLSAGARDGDPADAEALAATDGHLLVALEQVHRLERFALMPDGAIHRGRVFAVPPDWLPANRGIEALTELHNGWLAIAEHERQGTALALVGDKNGARWLTYRTTDGFLPTGADRLGDLIVVVERGFDWVAGWRARLVCLSVTDLEPGGTLVPREIASLEERHGIDNIEAVAIRGRGADVDVLLLSDDNFLWLQDTVLLQYRLPVAALAERGCAPGAAEPAIGEQ